MECTNLYFVIAAETLMLVYLAYRVYAAPGSSGAAVPTGAPVSPSFVGPLSLFDLTPYEITQQDAAELTQLYHTEVGVPNPTNALSHYVSVPKGFLGAVETRYSNYSESTHVLIRFGVAEQTKDGVSSNQLTIYFTPAATDGPDSIIDLGKDKNYQQYNRAHSYPPRVW